MEYSSREAQKINMKKNILMISGDSGIAHGKHNIFFEMLKEFSKYFKNIDIITGSNGIGKSFTIHGNVHIHPNNLSRVLRGDFFRHQEFAVKRAMEINKKHKLDFVISHVIPPFFPGTKAGIKIASKLGIPHYAEVMHIPGYPKASGGREFLEKKIMGNFLKKNWQQFDKIRIINSGETKKFILDLGVSENKLIYIPAFYVNFEIFKARKIKRNPAQFVYSGRFETNKNIFALLDAFKKISAKFPDAKLKMIGDGTLLNKVKKMTKNLNVEILGWLAKHEDLAKIYCESAALIMPSFSEGGPRVTLEAMACETAVLSTPVGIMKEVMNGKNSIEIGWTAEEIAEKMEIVLKNPAKMGKIGLEGSHTVQVFEYHKAIKNYAKTYLSL